MPAIEILLATIQDERRRQIETARLARAVAATRRSFRARIAAGLRRWRPTDGALAAGQPPTGSGSAAS